MKETLTVFGSGVGVPDLESGRDIRYPPAYLLERSGLKLLIECSPGTEIRLANKGNDYSDIKTIVISHFHPDHFGGLVNFVFFSRVKHAFRGTLPTSIKLLGPVGLEQKFNLIRDAFWADDTNPFDGLEIDFEELEGGGTGIELENGANLRGFWVFHESGKTQAMALRLEFRDGYVFAYSGDSGICDGLKKAAQNADVFLCEVSANIGEDKSGYGHMNPSEVGNLAKEMGVKRLLLTHWWGKDSDHDVINEVRKSGFPGDVDLVRDFQEISLL